MELSSVDVPRGRDDNVGIIFGRPTPKNFLGQKIVLNSVQFLTTSDFDREYLWNASTYRKSVKLWMKKFGVLWCTNEQVAQLLLGLADRSAHSRRPVQKLWCIHLAMLIYRDRGLKVKIRISVRVWVNPVQIRARYSHSSRKTSPNPNTKLNRNHRNHINTCVPVN